MNTIPQASFSRNRRRWGIGILFLTVLCFFVLALTNTRQVETVYAQVSPTPKLAYNDAIDLKTFGGAESTALSIDKTGAVVGWAKAPAQQGVNFELGYAFLYDGSLHNLGTLGAKDVGPVGYLLMSDGRDIDDKRTVVGQAQLQRPAGVDANLSHAYHYTGGAMQDIDTIANTHESFAEGINKNGDITVGIFGTAPQKPFVRTAAKGMRNLYTLGCALRKTHEHSGAAYGINDAGDIVGVAPLEGTYPNIAWHAFRCSPTTTDTYTAVDLGPPGSPISKAYRINNAGDIVGEASFNGGARQATLWDKNNTPTPLGFVPGGKTIPHDFVESAAYDINDHGSIVGRYHVGGVTYHAALWVSGQMYDLNDLLPAGSKWELIEARAINDDDQIAGTGIINGQKHAFLMTPKSDYDIIPTKIEVVQTIQDQDNSVPLIGTKRTFAVVHVHTDQNIARGITAELHAERNGVSLGPPEQPINNTTKRINIVPSPLRSNMLDSFVFELRHDWTTIGPITLRAEINPDKKGKETFFANNTISTNISFQKPDFLTVSLFNIGYDVSGTTHYATQRDQDLLSAQLRRMYPAKINASWYKTTLPINPTSVGCFVTNAYLWETRKIISQFNPDINHEALYAMVTDTGSFMRGCGFTLTGISSGPTGSSGFSWDTDGSYGDWYGTHEIGHSIGETHAGFCGAKTVYNTYPYPGGIIGGPTGNTEKFAGFDAGDGRYGIASRTIPPSWTDNMTYCNNQWISDYTYTSLLKGIQDANRNGFTLFNLLPNAVYGSTPTQNVLSVSGVIDLAAEQAHITNTARQSEGIATTGVASAPYRIRLLDANGSVAKEYPFAPQELSDGDSELSSEKPTAAFNVTIPFVDGTRKIAVFSVVADKEIGSVQVSANKPTVTITSPAANAILPVTGSTTFAWTGEDADDQDLSYTVLFSKDNKTTWQPLTIRTSEKNYTTDIADLPGGNQLYLRVIANDGVNTGSADAGPFVALDQEPKISIVSPAKDATYSQGQSVTLEAEGIDREEGQLPETAFTWSSDKDGQLGTGALFAAQSLSVGKHTLKLTVKDAKGHAATATTTVTVLNESPNPGQVLAVETNAIDIPYTHSTTKTAKTLALRNAGDGTSIYWTAESDNPRVVIDEAYGVTPDALGFTVNTAGLGSEDAFVAHITVTAPNLTNAKPHIVTITASSTEPTVQLSNSILQFSNLTVGATSPTRTVTLTSFAKEPLPVGDIVITGGAPSDFAIGNNTCKEATLTKDNSCSMSVTFKPSKTGLRTAYLSIPTGDTATRYVQLSGSGVIPTLKVYAWGNNNYGQLGVTGSQPDCAITGLRNLCQPLPVEVTTLQDVKKIAAGLNHSLAIKTDGTLWTWGANATGQLGTGIPDNPGSEFQTHPIPMQVMTNVKDVAASGTHTLAVKEDGTVWSWGSNTYGELGNNKGPFGPNQLLPEQVKGENNTGTLQNVTAVAAGDLSTGRMSMALSADGTVYTWGYNVFGVLATGSTEGHILTPKPVVGPDGTGKLTDVTAIALEMALKKDGTVWTWGEAANGQLGIGQVKPRSTVPVQVQDPAGGPLKNIVAIGATMFARYALTSDGKVWAWGNVNIQNGGQILGLGEDQQAGTAIPKLVANENYPDNTDGVTNVSVLQPNLVTKTDGTVWSWGNDSSGQLGVNGGIGMRQVVQVRDVTGSGFLTNALAIASSPLHRLAVTGSGGSQQATITVTADTQSITVQEGSSASVSGNMFHSLGGPVTLTASNGTVTEGPNGTWIWNQKAVDGPDEYDVTVTATDDDGLKATAKFKVMVTNVAPVISKITIDPISTACTDGATVKISFSIDDPAGGADPITGVIDWGDTASTNISSTTQTSSHKYAPGSYVVTVSANDADGGSASKSTPSGAVGVYYKAGAVLEPINTDGSSVFSAGNAIPVKIKVTDCTGAIVTTLQPAVTVTSLTNLSSNATIKAAGSSNTGNLMRFDGTNYIYNLSTSLSQSAGQPLQPGKYQVTITNVAMPQVTASFGLK